jgi:hypothetical protein
MTETKSVTIVCDPRDRKHRFAFQALGPNHRPHFLDRLHRERPDLPARVEAGELSIYAATIEAGWRRRSRRAAVGHIDHKDDKPAQAIVAAERGWFVVTACAGEDRKPVRLSEEPVIAWAVEAGFGELADGTVRRTSKAWPITAGTDKIRFDDGRWGLKKPNGEYEYAWTRFTSAEDCLAECRELALSMNPHGAPGEPRSLIDERPNYGVGYAAT